MHVVSVKGHGDAVTAYGCFLQPGPKKGNIPQGQTSQCLTQRAANAISRKGKTESLMELLICL